MAVATSSAGVRTALNRVEPFDPSFVADFNFTSTGDATGTSHQLTATFGVNEAFIPVFISGLNGSDTGVGMHWEVRPGALVAGQTASVFGSQLSQLVVAQNQFNMVLGKVAQTMFIPDLGSSGSMLITVDNADGEVVRMSARAYIWERDQILGLPCRIFWPYLL